MEPVEAAAVGELGTESFVAKTFWKLVVQISVDPVPIGPPLSEEVTLADA
jgi:hypothetical protein